MWICKKKPVSLLLANFSLKANFKENSASKIIHKHTQTLGVLYEKMQIRTQWPYQTSHHIQPQFKSVHS